MSERTATPDDDLIERVARATYEAHPWGDEDHDQGIHTWETLEDEWRDAFRLGAAAGIEVMRKASDDGHRAGLDFQMMLGRFIRRAKTGKDLVGTIHQAEDLLRRKGSLSPLRDSALAPAKPDGDA